MAVEVSNEPQAFQRFEHDGWETVSEGYDRWVSQLTNQSGRTLVANAVRRGGELVQDPGHLSQVILPFTGQRYVACAAAKQSQAEEFLQRLDLVTHRRLGHVKLLGGDLEAQVPRRRLEGAYRRKGR